MRSKLHLTPLVLLAACIAPTEPDVPEPTPAASGVTLTRWGQALDREAPLPEYPRPSLVRQRWRSLNGPWQFEPRIPSQPLPFDRELSGEILVPFPPESVLSGVEAHHEHLWYKRDFDVPTGWRSDRVLLHFGAVDWEAEVWVNGRRLALHRGGYDPFSVDITPALLPIPEQQLLVRVYDPADADEPLRGAGSAPVSGIWQTVWMEPVPRRGVDELVIEPSYDPETRGGSVAVTVGGIDLLGGDLLEVEVLERGGLLAARRGTVGERLEVPIPAARPWSPEDPFLYELRVTRTGAEGGILDRVESYFGLRRIDRVVGDDGVARLLLNGEPRFLMGALDQGWWPDGLCTAPADDALRFDVATAKAMGFALLRKHSKVEPERWYTWCDRLGVLVWQDIPDGSSTTDEGRAQFDVELDAILASRRSHPSIVGWGLFNEGWGQLDTARLTAAVQAADPTRLVTCASGWDDSGLGDVINARHEPGAGLPEPRSDRIAILGEHGGASLPVAGHAPAEASTLGGVSDGDELAFAYEDFARDVRALADEGLQAAIYRQLTDVETETNGLVTYDREVVKVAAERIARANRGQLAPLHTLLPTSEEGGRAWRYRFDAPAGDWIQEYGTGLDLPGEEQGWSEGLGGFGGPGTPDHVARTSWSTPEIWLVSDFTLGELPEGELVVRLHHDEDVTVWVNGHQVLQREGSTTAYTRVLAGCSARDVLRRGENRVAVHCRQTGGAQYVDVGLEVVGAR